MRRENTFRIDFSCFPVKPSFEKVHTFCRQVLGLKTEDVRRLQCHRGEQCAFVKVSDLTLAQQIVQEHDGRHEVECAGKKNKLRITLEDGSVEVKVHDLPESVTEEKIVEFLSAFGEVMSLHELTWGEGYEFGGVPLGIWSVRMLIRQNIDSWVTIDGQQAYIVYKGQVLSCKHCKEQAHTGISCVQNKKLLVQKSYANVAKQSGPRQNPKQTAGAKTPSVNSVGQRPTAPPPPSNTDAFPALPTTENQSEPSGADAQTVNQTAQDEQMDTLDPANQQAHSSSALVGSQVTEKSKTIFVLDDLFKKPISALQSQSKGGDGNETDTSTSSTNSKKGKGGRPPKKPRREGGNEEQGGKSKS